MDRLLSEREVIDAIEEVDWYEICNGKLTHGASGEDTALYKAKDIYRAINGVPSVKGDRDTISRQQTIDAILDLDVEHRVSWKDSVIDMLDEMPSAEPQKWTPCSQEMPDKDGWYLCSYESRLVQGCVFYCGKWLNGNADINKILAWMPLPSPYIWRE